MCLANDQARLIRSADYSRNQPCILMLDSQMSAYISKRGEQSLNLLKVLSNVLRVCMA